MKKIITCLFGLISLISSAQPRLIEKIDKKPGEIAISYEKYQLPNGLTILLHEDHSDPVVHVDVTYHVGSSREDQGRSGFAHFFEHMMFQGSDHVGDDQHFKMISQAGGNLNGTTNTDRTNYFETLPSNQLELALWLEADRMGFLLDAVTQKKFEVQRATVKNERGQNYDNRPYGRVNEKICLALYPNGHPYSWPTIGYLEDLDKADVNDLKKFFLRWYGPNNATLTVAGDINPKQVLSLVEKYFGPIERGPEVKMPEKPPVNIDKDRYISYEDNIRFPQIVMSFPTVPSHHADEAPLDILADILGGGKNSIMYQKMEKTQKSVMASAQHPTSELSGMMQLYARSFPGKSLSEQEALLRESLSDFEKRGVTEEDLQRYKATYEVNQLNSLATVSGKASRLAAYQTFTGNPNYISKELKAYRDVTKEDVMRVYNTYIKNKPSVILSVYPKGKNDLIAKPDNYNPVRSINSSGSEKNIDLVYKKAKDSFDRNQKPASGADPVLRLPEIHKETFKNGLKIIGGKSDEIPLTNMILSIEAGHIRENADKAGIAQLLAAMMNEGTEKYTAEQIENELEKLGSQITVSADKTNITVSISTLSKNLSRTLELAEQKIFHPKFDQDDFNRLKKQQLEAIGNQSTQPVVIANNVYAKLLYGNNHILGIPQAGTEASVNSITLEDVKNYYHKYLTPSLADFSYLSDLDENKIISSLTIFRNWKGDNVKPEPVPAAPKADKIKLFLVDKENAPQSEIRIGNISLPFDATGDYYKAGLMNFVLGGNFNSRINMLLRETRGFTYGARSSYQGDKYTGTFTASAGVRANATDSSVADFMHEILTFKNEGIKDDEVEFMKKSISQSEALKYESPFQKIMFLRKMVVYNLDKSFVDEQARILKGIKPEEINSLSKKYLDTDHFVIVVVGDKKKIRSGLEKLGYEIIEIDKDGNKILN